MSPGRCSTARASSPSSRSRSVQPAPAGLRFIDSPTEAGHRRNGHTGSLAYRLTVSPAHWITGVLDHQPTGPSRRDESRRGLRVTGVRAYGRTGVRAYSLTRALTGAPTDSHTHTVTHAPTHPPARPLTHSLTGVRTHGTTHRRAHRRTPLRDCSPIHSRTYRLASLPTYRPTQSGGSVQHRAGTSGQRAMASWGRVTRGHWPGPSNCGPHCLAGLPTRSPTGVRTYLIARALTGPVAY